ncbi:MAG: T9SS type A sorting domain-containing protein [Bacteroidota bacterium]|nr:T9SS type A sorting domain-containing protein [Bacteroidota bacterium]
MNIHRVKLIRKNLLLIVFICLTFNVLSQSTFNLTLGTDQDESYPLIEICDDSYLLLYNILPLNGSSINHKVSVDLINSEGEVSNIHFFKNDTIDFMIGNIIKREQAFYCHGLQKHVDSSFYRHWIFKIDENLSIVWQKTYESPFNDFFYETSMAFQEDNLIVSSSNFINNTAATQFLKFDLEGDLIHQKIYDSSSWEIIYDILIKPDPESETFYAFGSGFNGTADERLSLDSNFNIVDENNTGVILEHDAEWVNDTAYVLCGSDYKNDTMYITVKVMDTNMVVHEELLFKHNSSKDQHVGVFNGLSFIDNEHFYLGGSTHVNSTYMPSPTYIMLNKLNTTLHKEWQKYYGGDARYVLYSMRATLDGGCIMTGTRYDWNIQNNERDIFIMKINENGVFTSVDEGDFQVAEAIIYPNPGTDKLYIQSAFPVKEFQMNDINGRMVLKQHINSVTYGVDVSQLNSGIYLYQIIGIDGKIQRGKWIKR